MKSHPSGNRVLADRPKISEFVSSPKVLAAMPKGSFGRALHEKMNFPGGMPWIPARRDHPSRWVLRQRRDARRRALHHRAEPVISRPLPRAHGVRDQPRGEGLLISFQSAYNNPKSFAETAMQPLGLGPLLFLRPHVCFSVPGGGAGWTVARRASSST